MLYRAKLLTSFVLIFLAFLYAPLLFNISDPVAGRPQNKCEKHFTDPIHDPRTFARPNDDLKVIRLTNSGEFADRCDLTNALYELNWDRPRPPTSFGVKVKPGASHLPKLVLLYIHGWKHSADEDDSDRHNFEKLVRSLRSAEEGKRYVVGIFVGWNADSPLPGILENLTFSVKKNNADRIAQSSSVTEIYSAVGSIVKADPEQRDQFIAIGHSFGARLLFSATAQTLVSAVEQAHPGFPGGTYKVIQGLSDAIVLLNPAFEASRYSAINDFIRNEEAYAEVQAPLVVTPTSSWTYWIR